VAIRDLSAESERRVREGDVREIDGGDGGE
jgi:hypothetical protein